MRSVTILALFLALSAGTSSALPGDCTCKEENERWRKAKEKVKELEKQIQDVEKSIQAHEKKITALENKLAGIRAMLEALETTIDALLWQLMNWPKGNAPVDSGVASTGAGWAGLQAELDTLFSLLDTGSAGNLLTFSQNFFNKMSWTYSLAINIRIASAGGVVFYTAGIPYGMTVFPNVGAMTLLEIRLFEYGDQLHKLALVILDLGVEKLLLDIDRKMLPQLQEQLEKARAEEEAARKAFEQCLAEHHGGQLCAHVVESPTPTLKEKNLDLGTIDVLAATWLQPTGGVKK